MLNSYSRETLRYIAEEQKKGNGMAIVHDFCSDNEGK